ncbi:sulfate adenylyltransferase [Paucidesulfovibrio gracilis DSM 16080]|uniref:adenylyl-sulfate kinase n=1 Tax=Paucidesulfovibrio gracilis DSM 16080 TaxID=1121449 RepID=A0A1T4XEA0_9BACT|nr:adenylyl-sulfate kinase [Paucidesulfovibrio gracilis]SKA87737.1 sulfate adenylyltransferase [Paucidesulfovibrio gracilis DSM 16080]
MPSSVLLPDAEVRELRAALPQLPYLNLGRRALCDLELLMQGAFAPLSGYMNQTQYQSVLESMHLPDGSLIPLPVCLDFSATLAEKLEPGGRLVLNDQEGFPLAVLEVEDLWQPDKRAEARAVFGTDDASVHAGVRRFFEETGAWYAGGTILGLHLPMHHDSMDLRRSPEEWRAVMQRQGWARVLGAHPHGALHRVDREILLRAARRADAGLLLLPAADQPFLVDADHFHKVRCHRAFYEHLPEGLAELGLLPLACRGAGPREALFQALTLRSCGCTHFLVEPDQGEPRPLNGGRAYAPGAVFDLLEKYAPESGVEPVPSDALRFHSRKKCFVPAQDTSLDEVETPPTSEELDILLEHGREIPSWFTFPEVLDEMRRAHPPRHEQGLCVFFTGLSGAGKSTLAKILYVRFMEQGTRPVTLLDGDIVRRNLSSELGFSREHRVLNVTRIGFVASEIVKNRGIAICAPIAPYEEARRANRELISQYGGYVEVHVSTSLATCEARDRKGLYAKAKAGLKKGVTGVDDPFEPPQHADLALDTAGLAPEDAARKILLLLEQKGYVR